MSQGKAERELGMAHAAVHMAAETRLPLGRLFKAATLIGLAQATSVALDSLTGRQAVLLEGLRGPIDVLAKTSLLLLVLDIAATGFMLGCPQAGGVRFPSTEVFTKRRWFW